jgi:flagellar motor switch/type III secretory pathway protein FliN
MAGWSSRDVEKTIANGEMQAKGESSRRHHAAAALLSLCQPGPWSIQLPRLGGVKARLLGEDHAGCNEHRAAVDPGIDSLALSLAGHTIQVALDRRLALAVVNAALGLATPIAVAPLTRVEEGILHGALATLAGRIQHDLRLSSQGSAREPREPDNAVLDLAVEVHGQAGVAHVQAQGAFFEAVLLASLRAANAPVLPLHIELARTSVPSAALADAGVGDTVVFDETPPVSPNAAWDVCLRQDDRSLAATWYADGALALRAEHAKAQSEATCSHRAESTLDRPDETAATVVQRSAQSVTAELASVELRSLNLAALLRGEPFGLVRTDSATLVVRDAAWAEGRLVECDGALGVAITRKLAG